MIIAVFNSINKVCTSWRNYAYNSILFYHAVHGSFLHGSGPIIAITVVHARTMLTIM